MLQRLSIRGKLLAVVAVPILVLIVAAGVITLGSVQDLNSARNAEELVDTLDRARDLQHDLQTERDLAANYVHSVQDFQSKRRIAQETTASALDDIEERLSQPDVENPEEIQAGIDAALSRSGNTILAAERALTLGAPTDESGGWLVPPTEEEVTAMQEAYAAVVADLDDVIDSLPDDSNVGVPVSALAFRVNAESELATSLFTEPQTFQSQMAAVTSRVDSGVQGLLGSAASLGETEENDRAVQSLLAGQSAVADLEQMRASVRGVNTGPATVTAYYSDIINTIVTSADDVAVAMNDRAMVSAIQAYGDLDALVENIKYEGVVIERLIRAGTFLPGEAAQVRIFTTVTDLSLTDAQNSSAAIAGLDEVPPFGASVSDSNADSNSFSSVRTLALTGLDSSLFSARTSNWTDQVSEELGAYEPLRDQAWEQIQSQASSNAQGALVQTVLTAIAVAAVVIISIVVALIIARAIIGPLRRLTTTATAVRQELPRLVERVAIPGEVVDVSEVQIPVESRDEVGRLAEAFNGVNAATLDIAGEQAALRGSISEMFVNVARRDQVLLNRQLASIDEMERSEDNPNTLTKLFALDHLATRMRRNSESLLVLAGIDTGRRLRRPMPLSDVVRTASSEIELYERVQLELDVDPQMLGHSALTTAHLIAELLENATVFSDPGTAVVVRTAERGGNYVVEVEDSGIGMTAKELDDANNRVNSTSASEILGAQRLGLFVVGRIARRVGATVTLESQEGKGTLATVSIPQSMFATGEAAPVDRSPAGTVDEATHAPVALTRHNVSDEVADTPTRAAMGVDAYTPTAIEGGSSLTGRATPEQPVTTGASIEELIEADAANAPEAQPADPAALTDGSSAAGLPSRRRREAPQAADAAREQASIVGLPARATDAQLSALAAEGAGGFTPSVSAAEIAPKTAEQRASMFRGFRARGDMEDEAPAGASAQEPAGRPADDNQGVPVDSAGASPLPTRTPTPPAPEVPLEPTKPASPRDAGMAAAGAAGAAAFFARRARDAAAGEGSGTDASAADVGVADAGVASAPQPAAAEQFQAQEPSVPEFAAYEPSAADAQAPESSIPEYAAEEPAAPAEPVLPVFRMPKLEPDPVSEPETFDAQQIPALEEDEFDAPVAAPGFEASPYAVPALEEDPAEQPAEYAADNNAPATPYGGVEQVSPDGFQQPQYSQEQYEQPQAYQQAEQQYEQPAQQYDQQQYSQPAAPAQPEGGAPWLASPPPEPVSAASAEAATPDAIAPESATPEPATARPSAHTERANANLDALLQTAADNETEERPGFFSRLFGRGRHSDPDAAVAAATQWADGGQEDVAPSVASASTMSFSPVVEPPPEAAARERQAMFQAQSAPEPAEPAQPPVSASAPAAPASAAPWESAPQSFVPAPAPAPQTEPSVPEVPEVQAPPAPPSEPVMPTPLGTSLYEPAPWENREPSSVAPAQEFSPPADTVPAAPQTTFTPDELADATGWQAAGASALQAAQPDVATSYQPVIIQPDDGDGRGDADLASAVFSEFNSLASERPKVEKTRAGLERRRPSDAKPVEVKPIEDNVEIAPVKRDADAIRERFSSFYSGTQRARSHVATHDQHAQATRASDT